MIDKKYIHIFREGKNRPLFGRLAELEYKEIYEPLDLGLQFKEMLKQKILSEQEEDFQLEISDLRLIISAIEKKIEKLLKEPDFNPFKEELREFFPSQYSSYPFNFKGTTYYLYTKGSEFYIDSLINDYKIRLDYFTECINNNKVIKYEFR